MRALVLALALGLPGLAACDRFPEVDAAEAGLRPGRAPVLMPTDDLVARTTPPPAADPTAAALSARAEALRARAEAMRAPGA